MRKIKLFDPVTGKKEEQVIIKTLRSHFWASGEGGGNVEKFENEFRRYTGSQQCLTLNSGTAALHVALSLIDIRGKEVIVPSLSFVATAHAVVYNGGKPVFVDIDEKTLCINEHQVEKSINPKTAAILPVHFGGLPCNLNSLERICKENKIHLIEDAAHAAGAVYNNKKIGSHGFAVCFSFHPVKNLAMPTGGAITLNGKNSTKMKKIIESKRWCGISNRKGSSYDISTLGWNYYMNEFSAAIGLIQLSRLDNTNRKRKTIAKQYSKEINLENKMPFVSNCSYHLYWIRVKNRKDFMKKMKKNGIETGIHYNPLHKMSYYKNQKKLPLTEKISKEVVTLPIHPNLLRNEINFIIKMTNRYAKA